MSKFQLILAIIFAAFAVLAVVIFSGLMPGTGDVGGKVVLWGTLRKADMGPLLEDFSRINKPVMVVYEEKNNDTYENDLLNALASGQGPDLFLLPDDLILTFSDKLVNISAQALPEKVFRDTFIQEADLYRMPEGVLALPLAVDPMVMYYNRDLFDEAGIVTPPKTWDEFPALVSKFTRKDSFGNLTRGAVAMGSYDNVSHAKDILAFMMLQGGNPIITRDSTGGLVVSIDSRQSSATQMNPFEQSLRFYADFANPAGSSYTWDKSRPLSQNAFMKGDLAVYIGYASELFTLRAKNPNLNYDITSLPELKDAPRKIVFGRMQGVAVARTSKNTALAYRAATLLIGKDFAQKFSLRFSLPPARRDLLANKPAEPFYAAMFYDSALLARGWLDPGPKKTDAIFRSLVDDVVSGRSMPVQSISDAVTRLDVILKTYKKSTRP